MPRIDSATPPPDDLVYEAIDNFTNTSNATAGFFSRGGRTADLGVAITTNLLGAILGAPVMLPLFGRWWEAATSGVGGKGRQSTSTPMGFWPVGVDLAGIQSRFQYPARYDWTILIHRTPAPLALDVPFGVTLMWDTGTQNLLSLVPNTRVGIEVSSRSTVNGGNWTCYIRQVSAGALSSTDLLIHPDAGPLHVGFRYDATAANPRLVVLMNGAEALVFAGLANIIQPLTFANSFQRHAVTQNSAIVGQTDYWSRSHLKITRLPGYTL